MKNMSFSKNSRVVVIGTIIALLILAGIGLGIFLEPAELWETDKLESFSDDNIILIGSYTE